MIEAQQRHRWHYLLSDFAERFGFVTPAWERPLPSADERGTQSHLCKQRCRLGGDRSANSIEWPASPKSSKALSQAPGKIEVFPFLFYVANSPVMQLAFLNGVKDSGNQFLFRGARVRQNLER